MASVCWVCFICCCCCCCCLEEKGWYKISLLVIESLWRAPEKSSMYLVAMRLIIFISYVNLVDKELKVVHYFCDPPFSKTVTTLRLRHLFVCYTGRVCMREREREREVCWGRRVSKHLYSFCFFFFLWGLTIWFIRLIKELCKHQLLLFCILLSSFVLFSIILELGG